MQLRPKKIDEANQGKKVVQLGEGWATLSLGESLGTTFSLRPDVAGEWDPEPKLLCSICWVRIKEGEPISRCRACGRTFHLHHWKEWVEKKKSCPVCRAPAHTFS